MTTPFSFTRRELTSTLKAGPNCLLVYPPSKKAIQRVAVGDQSGRFSVFSMGKKLDRVPAFETGDENSAASGKPVSCACLFTDQLFFIRGRLLDAYSRKGKHFFTMDTNATEAIHTLCIETPYIFIAGDYMVTTFRETKELGFYMSPDRVNAMTVFCCNSAFGQADKQVGDYVCCFGCQDRVLRLVQDNKLLEEISVESAITAITHYSRDRYICYGTQAGSVGLLEITNSNTLRRLGGYAPPAVSGKVRAAASAIVALNFADVNADGIPEVLAGCDDGTVIVFTALTDIKDAKKMVLERVWSTSLPERVMSVAGGVITRDAAHPDILVHLYSGLVVAFTFTEESEAERRASLGQDAAATEPEGPTQREILAAKQAELEAELASLRQRIQSTAAELAAATGAAEKKASIVAVASTFEATVTLQLVPGTATLSLVVASDVPLEFVLLRSSADLRFISTDSSVVQHETLSLAANPQTRALAAVRPREEQQRCYGAKRFEVLLWATEGRADMIQATLYALPEPRTAQVKSVALCALPLYSRVNSFGATVPSSEMPFVLSRVTFTGAFSGRTAQEWLLQLLPGVSEVYQSNVTVMHFTSEHLRSVLAVELSEGAAGQESTAVFTSDSLTALAAVRQFVTHAAASGGYTVRCEVSARYGSAVRGLSTLKPMMKACAAATLDAQLLEGLRDLQGAEPELHSFLPDRLQEVLQTPDEITARAEQQLENEQYLKRAVVALYAALVEFMNHAPQLNRSLRQQLEEAAFGTGYSAQRLMELFFPHQEHLREREQLEAQLSGGTNIAAVSRRDVDPHSVVNDVLSVSGKSDADEVSAPSISSEDKDEL